MAIHDRFFLAAIMRAEIWEAAALRKLLRHFGAAAALLHASSAALMSIGVSGQTAARFREKAKEVGPGIEVERHRTTGVRIIPFDDPEYPALLKEIPDAPAALFVRGDSACVADALTIAVVGTRGMTSYGQMITKILVEPLASDGATIVSGLALGVDAIAHAAALEYGGPTVAVLGSGVDRASVGPRANAALAERIIYEGGCLISEYPAGVHGASHRFPLRNRIIAGLSRGTVVVEAPLHSGALITARAALDYNRDVFAVPGQITSQTSRGSNELLVDGAIPVISAETVPTHYGLTPKTKCDSLAGFAASGEAKAILQCIRDGHGSIESILQRTGIAAPTAMATITELELGGNILKCGAEFILTGSPRPR